MLLKDAIWTENERKENLIELSKRLDGLGFKVIPLELSKELYEGLTGPYKSLKDAKRIYKGTDGVGYKKALGDLEKLHGVSWKRWNKPLSYTMNVIRTRPISGLGIIGKSLRIDDDTYKIELTDEMKELLKEWESAAQVVIMSGEGKQYIFKEAESVKGFKKLLNSTIELLDNISYVCEYPYHNPTVIFRSDVLSEVPGSFKEFYEKEVKERMKGTRPIRLKKYESINNMNMIKFNEMADWDISKEHDGKEMVYAIAEYIRESG
ncbi:hypothetical protein GUITHDRAFT_133414 [Guillardia theta CCMP2712]|uniref:Uncharacterized protein n=1 Tax=Guillardia theta (strain CCMP2712) TaxID=905079 RepID=L1JXT9_GUITC|nr:hypothetical protein GUITHDRAFT_133414 [Guillardia theta CCMP2712]EKX53030.1 hypothetical protein GUITHDRAFT_133414 [Guillardia theta CCMP2712]|eukprot:XP_005840010.1 hypothetical protein GUITHDRAFT_133414 [Guillardia theta CCMP2712]